MYIKFLNMINNIVSFDILATKLTVLINLID